MLSSGFRAFFSPIDDEELERIASRGFVYCYWRHGLLRFAIPMAILVPVVVGVWSGQGAVEILRTIPWFFLVGMPTGALLWSLSVWNQARAHAKSAGSRQGRGPGAPDSL